MNKHIIFDLDGTVVDSSHRTSLALVDGQFCLDTYFAKCNSDAQIMQDSLLPLAKYMQELAADGVTFSIITARTMRPIDSQFLWANRLINMNTLIFDRTTVHSKVAALSDADYKVYQLNRLKCKQPYTPFMMFDDHPCVISTLNGEDNIEVLDAKEINKALRYLTDGGDTNTDSLVLDLSQPMHKSNLIAC